MLRAALVAGVALGTSACANQSVLTMGHSTALTLKPATNRTAVVGQAASRDVVFGPAMMVGGPDVLGPDAEPGVTGFTRTDPQAIADQLDDLRRKSMAAKVLTARALEAVTGMKPDPARLSEHD
jgi:hypothetical protein